MRGYGRFFILFNVALFIFACGSIVKKEPFPKDRYSSPEAVNLVSMLKNTNNTLKTFKGVGTIRLWDKNRFQVVRAAWAGAEPDRFRVELLGISGHPMASLAKNKEWLYFLSHTEKRFYKKRSPDADLKKIILMPVKFDDIIALLTGRAPLDEHSFATVKKNPIRDGYILLLGKKSRNIIEKIYLNENKRQIEKIEVFDKNGKLVYRAIFVGMQKIEEYLVPLRLTISNDDGINFQVDIDKYLANVSVSPSMFVLTPSE